jgi:hypothetical protein
MNNTAERRESVDSTRYSASPTVRRPNCKISLRKYAKPIIFHNTVSEDRVFKNMSASFKLRPSLKISNYSIEIPLPAKKKTRNEQQGHVRNQSADTPTFFQTQIVRQNTPTKYRPSRREKMKPMFRQYAVNSKDIEVNGRPCSRTMRYPYFEIKDETKNERNKSPDWQPMLVNVKRLGK